MDGVVEGRIVHFVMDHGPYVGQHRAAMIVRVWNTATGMANLTVFPDWDNDHVPEGLSWQPSVPYSEDHEPRTWHWIERA